MHSLDGYDVRRAVLGLVAEHMRPSAFQKSPTPVGDGAFRRLAQKVDLELLARFAEADCHGRTRRLRLLGHAQWFLERARALGVEHAPPAPLVLGRHLLELGVAPGPRMGEILQVIYEKQLDGEITTLDEGVDRARRWSSWKCEARNRSHWGLKMPTSARRAKPSDRFVTADSDF